MAAAALARALAAHGVGKGDRVLVHSRNSFEFVETLFATLRLGAVWVPTNFRIAPDEAAYLAQASGAKVFLCQGDYADHAEAVARACRSWRCWQGWGRKASPRPRSRT